MGFVTPDYGTIFWMLIIFGIVLFILKKYAWGPILKALKDRELSISEALNSFTDILVSIGIKIAVKMSHEKPDQKHQFGHNAAANYYCAPNSEKWQQYQQAAVANANRKRKRLSKSTEDGEEYEDDDSGDGDGFPGKQRKTRPNFSKDVTALLTTWILNTF